MKSKKLMFLSILITIVLLNCGCMITQEDYLRAAEKYMKKKYGEEFQGKYFYGITNRSIYVVPKSNPNWYVTVIFEKPKLESVKFHDNYVAFLVKEELENNVQKSINELYGDSKVFCAPMGVTLPDNWGRDTLFEEYRKEKIFTLSIYISSDPANRDIDIIKLKEIYYSLKVNFSGINIVYISGEQLKKLDKNKADQISSDREYICKGWVFWDIANENPNDIVNWSQGKY